MARRSMRVAKATRRTARSSARLDVDVPVSRVMVRDPVRVAPGLSAALARLLMLDEGVSALPVVDEAGRPLGVLSNSDVARLRARGARVEMHELEEASLCRAGLPEELQGEQASLRALSSYFEGVDEPTVADLMSPIVLSVSADTPVVEAARLMADHDLHHLPITGRRGELVGILCPFDLVRAIARLPAARAERERVTG